MNFDYTLLPSYNINFIEFLFKRNYIVLILIGHLALYIPVVHAKQAAALYPYILILE